MNSAASMIPSDIDCVSNMKCFAPFFRNLSAIILYSSAGFSVSSVSIGPISAKTKAPLSRAAFDAKLKPSSIILPQLSG